MNRPLEETAYKIDNNLYSELQVKGNNHCILFLHGFPDDKTVWYPIIEKLDASPKTLLALDLPHFGQTISTEFEHSLQLNHIVNYVKQRIEKENFDSISIVGHDWGASVAWLLAKALPQKVNQLFIANGTHPHLYAELVNTHEQQTKIFRYFERFIHPKSAKKLMADGLSLLKAYRPELNTKGCLSQAGFKKLWSSEKQLKSTQYLQGKY